MILSERERFQFSFIKSNQSINPTKKSFSLAQNLNHGGMILLSFSLFVVLQFLFLYVFMSIGISLLFFISSWNLILFAISIVFRVSLFVSFFLGLVWLLFSVLEFLELSFFFFFWNFFWVYVLKIGNFGLPTHGL